LQLSASPRTTCLLTAPKSKQCSSSAMKAKATNHVGHMQILQTDIYIAKRKVWLSMAMCMILYSFLCILRNSLFLYRPAEVSTATESCDE
jgi:hypothetical protein